MSIRQAVLALGINPMYYYLNCYCPNVWRTPAHKNMVEACMHPELKQAEAKIYMKEFMKLAQKPPMFSGLGKLLHVKFADNYFCLFTRLKKELPGLKEIPDSFYQSDCLMK